MDPRGSGIMKLLERMARSNLPSGELGDVAGLMEDEWSRVLEYYGTRVLEY